MSRQLPLPFRHSPPYRPDSFLRAPAHDEVFAWLDRPADWPAFRFALWGETGVGKTHLLRLWAARSGAALLDPRDVIGLPRMPDAPAIAIDDAAAAPDPAALLHVLNAASEAARPLLLTSREAPARWDVALPDLASRLRATLAVCLPAPDDASLACLFRQLLAERNLPVEPRLQAWLLRRLPRSADALREAAGLLDREAYADGGRVSRAVAATVALAFGHEGGDDEFLTIDAGEAPQAATPLL